MATDWETPAIYARMTLLTILTQTTFARMLTTAPIYQIPSRRTLTETEWVGENFATFWGGYGIVKLKLPTAVYVLLAGLSVLGLTGLVARIVGWWGVRRRRSDVDWLPAVMAMLFFGLLALSLWSSYTVDMALHGRYLFPEFLPFVALLAIGLSAFAPLVRRARPVVAATIPVMVAGNLAYVLHVLVPDVVAFG